MNITYSNLKNNVNLDNSGKNNILTE